jgi:hypothetical protein
MSHGEIADALKLEEIEFRRSLRAVAPQANLSLLRSWLRPDRRRNRPTVQSRAPRVLESTLF